MKCKYCEKVLTAGIYSLKHHLVETSKDIGACIANKNVKLMLGVVYVLHQNLIKRSKFKEFELGE